MQKYCPNCGTELNVENNFCSNCKHSFKSEHIGKAHYKEIQPNKNKQIIIVIAIVILIVIAIVGFLGWSDYSIFGLQSKCEVEISHPSYKSYGSCCEYKHDKSKLDFCMACWREGDGPSTIPQAGDLLTCNYRGGLERGGTVCILGEGCFANCNQLKNTNPAAAAIICYGK